MVRRLVKVVEMRGNQEPNYLVWLGAKRTGSPYRTASPPESLSLGNNCRLVCPFSTLPLSEGFIGHFHDSLRSLMIVRN
jgi:hypothetical protein